MASRGSSWPVYLLSFPPRTFIELGSLPIKVDMLCLSMFLLADVARTELEEGAAGARGEFLIIGVGSWEEVDQEERPRKPLGIPVNHAEGHY